MGTKRKRTKKSRRDPYFLEKSSSFIEDSIQRCCPLWFEIARGQEPDYNPSDLNTQVWLLSVLNLRQALIKWQSWNCNIKSKEEILNRYKSFVEQVKVMAYLLDTRTPRAPPRVRQKTSAVIAIRNLLRFDCTRWLDEQLVKMVGLNKQWQANLYEEDDELFIMLQGELEIEWGPQNTKAVINHERQRQSKILNCTDGRFSTAVTALSLIVYTADVGSDVTTGIERYKAGDAVGAVLTLIWVVWVTIVIFSENLHKCAEERSLGALLISPVLPILDIWRELTLRWRVWCKKGSISERRRAMVELGNAERRASAMSLTKAKNEALPQLLMQIQLTLVDAKSWDEGIKLLNQFHVLTSIVSACWSHSHAFRGGYCPTGYSVITKLVVFFHDCLILAALVISMSLFFWVAPLSLAMFFWLCRSLLFMKLDRLLTVEEFFREISTPTGCVALIERVLYYGTHPFIIKHMKFVGAVTFLVELTVLLGTYTYVCSLRTDCVFDVFPVSAVIVCFFIGMLIHQFSLLGQTGIFFTSV